MAQPKKYQPGDIIRVEIEFEHQMNIHSIEARFVSEAEGNNVILFSDDARDAFPRDQEALTTRTHTTLEATIEVEGQAKGLYQCDQFYAKTPTGAEVMFTNLLPFTFEVIPERTDAPRLGNWRVVSSPDRGLDRYFT
jgi:hypothetical protein